MQVQSISSGQYALRAYAFPFLHSSIRSSASSCMTALKLAKRPIDHETYNPLWARAFATRNNSQTPKIGSLPRWYGTSSTQVRIGRVFLAVTSERCLCYERSTYCKLPVIAICLLQCHWLANSVVLPESFTAAQDRPEYGTRRASETTRSRGSVVQQG